MEIDGETTVMMKLWVVAMMDDLEDADPKRRRKGAEWKQTPRVSYY